LKLKRNILENLPDAKGAPRAQRTKKAIFEVIRFVPFM